ncbi:hypothetical protein H6504_04735 [Candidatus Woesearchaeota archaeon]|nr:hypothetical protein [Candidatus Woesearchaeota archaeon]
MFEIIDSRDLEYPTFRGIHLLHLDAKHRFALPSALYTGKTEKLLIDPVRFNSVDALSVYMPEHRVPAVQMRPDYVLESLYLEPLEVALGTQNRLTIPVAYRKLLGVERDIVLAGAPACFYIFNEKEFLDERPNLVSRL